MKPKRVILTILDGWGLAPPDKFNAIDNAKTPNFDKLVREFPNTRLKTDGLAVGLPEGQFGTSEVNHLTIGSGRIILQDLPRINTAIEDGSFQTNPALLKVIQHCRQQQSRLHLLGILSDGGVHTHIKHWFAIFDLLEKQQFDRPVYLHIFTDGRDVPPKSAEKYFTQLDKKLHKLKHVKVCIATIQGRSYLDRDREWERTEKAFQLIANGEGNPVSSWQTALNMGYLTFTSDEHLPQYLVNPEGLIKAGDGMIIPHYRTDRLYQIIRRVLDAKLANFELAAFVQASEEFSAVHIAFPRIKVSETLSEVIANVGLKQLHVTETEKFAHLTFFFNGEKEKEMAGEEWKMFTSNRYIKPQYNFDPSMRNFDTAKTIIEAISQDSYNFILANFASPDMVGHTGNYEAAVVSAESIDYCLGKIYEAIKDKLDDYVWMITADHGNSEIMWDYKNKQPHTQHTLSRVPFILVSNLNSRLDPNESLSNIAPTVLDLMGLKKPAAMTGTSLLTAK